MITLETANAAVGIATVALQFIALALLGAYVMRRRNPQAADIGASIGEWGLWAGFALTAGGVVLSLFYSEVLGLVPCGLCWLMRIFMYSQAVLFAVALYKRDRGIADYSIALSIFGLFLGLYQHYLQMGGESLLPCPASGVSDCAKRFLFEFGYITFPLAGATLFALLILVMMFVRERQR